MNVAVCISGAMRGDLDTLINIQKNIVDPLNADVFILTWNRYYAWPGIGGAGTISYRIFGLTGNNALPNSLDTTNAFKKNFPRTYKKLSAINTKPLDTQEITSRIKSTLLRIDDELNFEKFVEEQFSGIQINQLKMFYSICACNNMMNSYACEMKKKYDYVIRVRPDIGIKSEVTHNIIEKIPDSHLALDFIEFGPNDQFFIAKHHTMNQLCTLWNVILDKKRISPSENFINIVSHRALFMYMIQNSIFPYITNGKIKRLLYSATYRNFPDLWLELAEDFKHEAASYVDDPRVRNFFTLIHQRKYAQE